LRRSRSGAPRTGEVFVTEDVVALLGSWWGECGKPTDEKLVLPGETTTGYSSPQVILRRELYPAMKTAGIPRVGPTGEKRTFHSLRHAFARIAIENNRPFFWLSKHLGHSSLDVTSNVYGHFEKATASGRRRRWRACSVSDRRWGAPSTGSSARLRRGYVGCAYFCAGDQANTVSCPRAFRVRLRCPLPSAFMT